MPIVVAGLVKVCAGIVVLLPLAVNPVTPSGLEPVQVKLVPATFEPIEILWVAVPLQIVCAAGSITCGAGFTMIL